MLTPTDEERVVRPQKRDTKTLIGFRPSCGKLWKILMREHTFLSKFAYYILKIYVIMRESRSERQIYSFLNKQTIEKTVTSWWEPYSNFAIFYV